MVIQDFVIIVLAGLIGGAIAQKLRQPLILGYIIVGVLVGPNTGGLYLTDAVSIAKLADIGVALLLFSMGLEFSIRDLKPIWKITTIGALVQVALTLVLGTLIGLYLEWNIIPSLILGIAIVSSSTAVILKSLTSMGQMRTLSSKVMLGLSIVQDLAVIPLLLVVESMAKGGGTFLGVFQPLIVASMFVLLAIVVGSPLIKSFLKYVAKWNSQELFVLCVLTISIGIGCVAESLDISLAFGAFIAGLILNGSDYGHKALSDLIPLRDMLAMFFFVSVGMFLDPAFVVDNILVILLIVLVACVGRGIILSAMCWSFGYRNIIPLAAFLGMIPISEIGFIVVRSSIESGTIDQYVYSIIMNTIVLSMIFGPILSEFTAPLYLKFRQYFPSKVVRTVDVNKARLKDHVVIAGGGYLGLYLAQVLQKLKIPYVNVEPNYTRFVQSQSHQIKTIFGDPKQTVILNSAKLSDAKILIVTSDGLADTVGIIENAKVINPDLVIVTEFEGHDNVKLLKSLNIYEVVQPENEVGLEIVRQALLGINMPKDQVQQNLDMIRSELYAHDVK